MTLTDSAVQVGSMIEVELRNPAAAGTAFVAVACPDSSSTLFMSSSPLYTAQLRGYTK